MTTSSEPTRGHTPTRPVDSVAPGVGARLAEWTVAAMAGAGGPPADLDAASARSLRRVTVAVDALRGAVAEGGDDGAAGGDGNGAA